MLICGHVSFFKFLMFLFFFFLISDVSKCSEVFSKGLSEIFGAFRLFIVFLLIAVRQEIL